VKQESISMPHAGHLVVRQPVTYGYARVSTGKQKMSPEAQKEAIEAYYQEHLAATHTWGGVFVEPHTSARKTAFLKRPVGKELDTRLERGDCVVAAKFDRIFRSLGDFGFMRDVWKDRGVHLQFCNLFGMPSQTNVGRMTYAILAAVAEFEAEMVAERTREMKQYQKRHGLATNGHAGYGYKFVGGRGNKKRVPDPEERGVMAWIVKQHMQNYTWRDMYLALRDRGVKTRKGKEWSIARIRRACVAAYLLRAKEEASKLGFSAV
jgi:DNA invertase Pin-like site-specific DNA recombinase